jgi:hypothetical protein
MPPQRCAAHAGPVPAAGGGRGCLPLRSQLSSHSTVDPWKAAAHGGGAGPQGWGSHAYSHGEALFSLGVSAHFLGAGVGEPLGGAWPGAACTKVSDGLRNQGVGCVVCARERGWVGGRGLTDLAAHAWQSTTHQSTYAGTGLGDSQAWLGRGWWACQPCWSQACLHWGGGGHGQQSDQEGLIRC